MSRLRHSCGVRGSGIPRARHEHKIESRFRHKLTSSLTGLHRARGVCSELVPSTCILKRVRVNFHQAENRVASGNRVRRPTGEGMASGRASAQPLLKCRSSSSYCEPARSNRSPREQTSVGMANHCARRFNAKTTYCIPECSPAQSTAQTCSGGALTFDACARNLHQQHEETI